ncbi:MAG: hypothetical protein IRY96_03965 [Burkholderiales bacterium]|nr:hypothetical protein [Burkholderiales bacterium]
MAKRPFAATLGAGLLAFALAIARADTEEDPLFDRLDADMDGFLSRTEAARDKELAQRFERLDLNRDGRLDKLEFEAQKEERKPAPQPTPD